MLVIGFSLENISRPMGLTCSPEKDQKSIRVSNSFSLGFSLLLNAYNYLLKRKQLQTLHLPPWSHIYEYINALQLQAYYSEPRRFTVLRPGGSISL